MHMRLPARAEYKRLLAQAYTSLPLDGDETIVSFLAVKPEPANPA